MAGLLGLWWDGAPAQGGIACRVRIFCHISEPRGGLQSQTGDGAARASEGLPAAVPPAGEGFSVLYQSFYSGRNEYSSVFQPSFFVKCPNIRAGAKNPPGITCLSVLTGALEAGRLCRADFSREAVGRRCLPVCFFRARHRGNRYIGIRCQMGRPVFGRPRPGRAESASTWIALRFPELLFNLFPCRTRHVSPFAATNLWRWPGMSVKRCSGKKNLHPSGSISRRCFHRKPPLLPFSSPG